MNFTVLFVCTGNICRSPMAERVFRARLDPALPVRTTSAGTSGLTGWEMDAPSAIALREVGGDPEGHCAQRLSRHLIDDADLVLTAECVHRDAIARFDPSAAERAFTLREFGHFGDCLNRLSEPTPDALRARVAHLAVRRAAAPPLPHRLADIGDPYGAHMTLVRACARQVAVAVDAAIDALGLQHVPRASA
jgi:protein-tyrosine phosphatase